MPRHWSLLSLIAGVALLLGAPLVWWSSMPATQVGDLEVLGLPDPQDVDPLVGGRTESDSSGNDSSGNADVSGDARVPNAEETARDGVPAAPEPGMPGPAPQPGTADPAPRSTRFTSTPVTGAVEPAADPVRIGIPAIGVDAPLDAVGIEESGEMQIPSRVERAGWFAPTGVRPGDRGTAVIAGHVDSRTQGRGAFFRLAELELDDEVVITDDDGGTSRWVVEARTSYGKDDIPIDELFTRTGEPRLALITCGGDFDAATRSYAQNIVVIATPAG